MFPDSRQVLELGEHVFVLGEQLTVWAHCVVALRLPLGLVLLAMDNRNKQATTHVRNRHPADSQCTMLATC